MTLLRVVVGVWCIAWLVWSGFGVRVSRRRSASPAATARQTGRCVRTEASA